MSIITLTTDFGHKSYSTAIVKATLHKKIKDITIIDISNDIDPFDIIETAYFLKNSYFHFPEGTIHIIGVDSECTPNSPHVVIFFNGHYFIGKENGVFSLIGINLDNSTIIELDSPSSSFSTLNVFVEIATKITEDNDIDALGKKATTLKTLTLREPIVINNNQITGSVVHIDGYGNIITNITKELFTKVGKNRTFSINSKYHKFDSVHDSYSHAINFNLFDKRGEEGKDVVIFNSLGHLELAIYRGNPVFGTASTLFGVKKQDPNAIIENYKPMRQTNKNDTITVNFINE